MSTDQVEKIKTKIAEALAGDPDSFTVELSNAEFDPLGAALDGVTGHAESRGYNLTRVRAEEDRWIASYSKRRSGD